MKAEGQRQGVVLDTNVLISAALSKNGAPAQVVRHVFAEHAALWSEATFAELQARLWKPKIDRYISLEDRRSFLQDARAIGTWVAPAPAVTAQKYSRDPTDDMFIHTALAGGARLLVTGDQDLLTLPPLQGLKILTPAQALGALGFI